VAAQVLNHRLAEDLHHREVVDVVERDVGELMVAELLQPLRVGGVHLLEAEVR
jgi:hypothetical protein